MSATVHVRRRDVPATLPTWTEGLHPVLARVFATRGIADASELDLRLGRLLPPDGLDGLAQACALLDEAIERGERIVVVGDYDADGATATAVAVRGLRLLGAPDVAYRVPNRAIHGYGLTPALVDELAALAPRLVVTVDNGIASHAGVARARALGMRVLVTDHHLPGPTLPDADAIVNPNVAGCAFPGKSLAGVGVMFYVLLALRAARRTAGRWRGEVPDLGGLLDLVALGTVADLVPLDGNNRVLVAAGLRRIRAGERVTWFVAEATPLQSRKRWIAGTLQPIGHLVVDDYAGYKALFNGKVTEVGDSFVAVEIADGVRIKVQRFQITQLVPKGTLKSA